MQRYPVPVFLKKDREEEEVEWEEEKEEKKRKEKNVIEKSSCVYIAIE